MIRFPIDLRVTLMKKGLRLSPWETVIFKRPEPGVDEPEILRYRFETMHGILCFSPTLHGLAVIAVCNDMPGNGSFTVLMDALENTAYQADYPMIVGSIWNLALRRHLIVKRGYKDCKEPGCEDSVIKPLA